uniref:Uncharacterized protein n=1 Tax=viral metagenome TaxID=1070528 RepID=A0A6M3J783_9ZZZZ
MVKEGSDKKKTKRRVRVVDSDAVHRALARPGRDKMVKGPPTFKSPDRSGT